MKVKFWGTRGSLPVSGKSNVDFGGNTTCLEIFSECLPVNFIQIIDAGSGILPLAKDLLGRGTIDTIIINFTHYHHDHTQGLPLAWFVFDKRRKIRLYGPVEDGIGPKEMMKKIMFPPLFPIHFDAISSHFVCKNLEHPTTLIGLFHRQGGYKLMGLDEFERLIEGGSYLSIGKGKYPVNECMVVRMYYSNHPERTISYRFEERPTGKNFVILTDHENQDGIPFDLQEHLRDLDLLVIDSQYTRSKYNERTSGFGHGTPDYCMKVAKALKVKKVGLTHHDPYASDDEINAILQQALDELDESSIEVFACRDYSEVVV
jgi:phosphoribosyl 1,2-cyclic phosphodiesterase